MGKANPKKTKRRKNSKEWTKVAREYKQKIGDRYHANKVTKDVKKILSKKRK